MSQFKEENIKEISKRFINGEETIEDILDYCKNYEITFENGTKMRLVEKKYLDRLIEEYKKLLAEREEDKKRIQELEDENRIQRHQIMTVYDNGYVHKDKIKEDYIPKQKVKNRIKENKKLIDETYSEDIIQKLTDENEILQELLEDK